mgnify:CR=1 FL=1|tara:strand:- start:4949 stop:5572 length:624 start_codon:yes stop_codon:yes gene_type:complete
MSATNTLNKVKTLLGLEVGLEQMKLDNGTVLEAEAFEAGQEVFIVTEDEKVALPVGEYTLEDGTMLVVTEEGLIASMGEVETEAETEEEVVEEEVEADEEIIEEEVTEEDLGYVSKEEFGQAIDEIKAMIDEVKAGYGKPKEEKEEKEEMTAEVENAELKEELSKPATEAIKHAPKEESVTKGKFNFNKNKSLTAYDRIVAKISNIK